MRLARSTSCSAVSRLVRPIDFRYVWTESPIAGVWSSRSTPSPNTDASASSSAVLIVHVNVSSSPVPFAAPTRAAGSAFALPRVLRAPALPHGPSHHGSLGNSDFRHSDPP